MKKPVKSGGETTPPDRPATSACAPLAAPEVVGTRARKKAEKLFRISRAARQLFHERGYDATTVQAVASLAEIGAGTLFSYAKTKEDLLIIVFMDELIEVVLKGRRQARRKTDLLDRVTTVFSALLKFHMRDAELSRHLAREVAVVTNPERAAEVSRLVALLLGSVSAFIREAIAQGAFAADADVERVTMNCFSIYYLHLTRTLTEPVPIPAACDELRAALSWQIRPLQLNP